MVLRLALFRRLAAILLIAASAVLARGEQDLTAPLNHLGNADSGGKLVFWRDLMGVGLESRHPLPLRIRFATAGRAGIPLFGRFWYCPLLESSLVNKSEKVLVWQMLGGRLAYLKLQKDGSFQSYDGTAVAKAASPSEWLLSCDGWQYRYVSGRLREVKIDDGTELEWVYQGARLMGINDRKRGTLLTVEYAANAEYPSALVAGKTRLECAYQKMPVVTDVMGAAMVAGFEDSLLSVEGGGLKECYAVDLSQDGTYHLVETSKTYDTREASWDGRTGLLEQDGNWRYEVKQDPAVGSIVMRRNEKNQLESYYYDTKTGTSEHQRPDGSLVKRTYFEAAGPTFHKIRKAVETKDGKEVAARQWSYDDMGRLIRDRAGNIERTWDWSADGKLQAEAELIKDKVTWEKRYDAEGRVSSKTIKGKEYRYSYDAGKTIIQQIAKGQVVSSKVIDPKTSAVAFFKPNIATGALEGTALALTGTISPANIETARQLAQRSLQAIANEIQKP